MRRPAGSAVAGFTLLEVIIALIIAGLAAAALLQAVGVGLRATTSAAMYDQAIVRAKSRLAAASDATRLRAGDTQGDDGGGFHWQLRVVPVQTAVLRPAGLIGPRKDTSLAVTLYRVITTISWHDGDAAKQVTLQTEQVGSK